MNALLKQLLTERRCLNPAGEVVEIHSNVDAGEIRFIVDILSSLRPNVTTTLEVGLAFGVSALAICDAIKDIPGAKHIVMDPVQTTQHERLWNGVGLYSLERAGLRHLVEFHESASYAVLPQLVSQRRSIDFAFVDGSHLFDDVFLDFYYIDKMLRIGGVVVFDDLWMEAVARVCRYVVRNRHYRVAGTYRLKDRDREPGLRRRVARRIAGRMPNAHRIFRAEVYDSGLDQVLGIPCQAIALEKVAGDDRPWNFHRDF